MPGARKWQFYDVLKKEESEVKKYITYSLFFMSVCSGFSARKGRAK